MLRVLVTFLAVVITCECAALDEELSSTISQETGNVLPNYVRHGNNKANALTCQRCSRITECEPLICNSGDSCYVNKLDERRGCTSDGVYQKDNIEFQICDTNNCNRPPQCIVCSSDKPEQKDCLRNPEKYSQECEQHGIFSEKNCFRYEVDGDDFRLGCTSEENLPPCNTFNCKTCELENCNSKEFQRCYLCDELSECRSIDPETHLVDTCDDYDSLCYYGYTRTNKKTSRGCTDGLDPAMIFDISDTCATQQCNHEEFPTHRQCHQCETCEGSWLSDYCDDVDAQKCFTMEMNDGTIHRGCDTDGPFNNCVEYSNCLVCDSDYCNANEVQPECVACGNSVECKTDALKTCPGSKFYDGCYLYQDGAKVGKGCLNELTDPSSEEYLACRNGAESCTRCTGVGCNGLHCVSCDSRHDKNCVIGEETLRYELCSIGDSCLMYKDVDGYTVRGCSETFPELTCGEDCVKSDGPASNGGLFPVDARQCYQCKGNCDRIQPEQASYCNRNNELGCYYKVSDNSIYERGCVSDENSECSEGSNCVQCSQENNCNSVEFWNCFTCSGHNCFDNPTETCRTSVGCVVYTEENGDIVRECINDDFFCDQNPLLCRNLCKTDNCNNNDVCAVCESDDCYEVCNEHRPGNKCFRFQKHTEVILGCIENITPECNNNHEYCLQCDTNLCNTEELAECFVCSNCPTIDEQITKHCANRVDQCFTAISKDGMVIRGCSDEQNDSEELLYISECSRASCNADPMTQIGSCYQCDNCSSVDGHLSEICINPSFSGCYTMHDIGGRSIIRGCVHDEKYESCREDINCRVCSQADCNVEKALNTSLLCVSCSGQECLEHVLAKPCQSEGLLIDYCVTFTDQDTVSFKGCLSDGIPHEMENDCYSTKAHCEMCEYDHCNASPLSCYQCSSIVDGNACITNTSIMTKIDCAVNEVCVTFVDHNGHLHRGCLNYDEEIVCREDALCETCQSSNCNVHIVPENRQYCYQCSGENCVEINPLNIESKPCTVYSKVGFCYTYVEDETSVYRGCSSDESPLCENNSLCIPCNQTNSCNSQGPFVSNQLSCIKCTSNGNCDEIESGSACHKPLLLGREDACYTEYWNELVIGKGCLSDLDSTHPWYTDCSLNNSKCDTCIYSDCNHGNPTCYVCNSAYDTDCVELHSKNHLKQCRTDCVVFLDDEGYTVRGCAENFPELNLYDCTESTFCSICDYTECNTAILPANRLKCYQCKGSEDDCLSPKKSDEKWCARYQKDDSCYTYFDNATWVVRDCISNTDDEFCSEGCIRCGQTGCNKQEAFHPNTLSCVHCQDSNCKELTKGEMCSKEILLGRQDLCYVYQHGATVRKGCLSDLEQNSLIRESCEDDDSKSCVLCAFDDCNGDVPLCITCDAAQNFQCNDWFKVIASEYGELCPEKRCISYVGDDKFVKKGCAGAEQHCEENNPICLECTGSLCNNERFPVDRMVCHQCENCSYVPSNQPAILCPKYYEEEACFIFDIDGITHRGCLSQSDFMCDESTHTCWSCSDNGCNDQPLEIVSSLSCIHCRGYRSCLEAEESLPCNGTVGLGYVDECYSFRLNGEILAKGCFRNEPSICDHSEDCERCSCNGCNFVTRDSPSVKCHVCNGETCGMKPFEGEVCTDAACISYVSKEGVVSRGCLQMFEQKCSIYGTKHDTCFKDFCNEEIYPSNRIKCYRCTDCPIALGDLEICPKFMEGDGCFTSDYETVVTRGCLSELGKGCSGSNCSACYYDGCNSESLIETSTASSSTTITSTSDSSSSIAPKQFCIRCVENSTNPSCAWGFPMESAELCPSESETGCFTCVSKNITVRGCTSEIAQNSCQQETIEICSENGCNNENQRAQYCIICTNDCDVSKNQFEVEQCSGVTEYFKRGCYTLKNVLRTTVERGCVTSLSPSMLNACHNTGDACEICYEDGCNGAGSARVLNKLLISLLFMSLFSIK